MKGMRICTGIKFNARCFATAVLVDPTTAYIFGGCTWNEVFFNDLTKLTLGPISEDEYRRHMMTNFGTGVYEDIESQGVFQARDGSQHHRNGTALGISNGTYRHMLPAHILQPYRPERYHFELAPNKSVADSNSAATQSAGGGNSIATHSGTQTNTLGQSSQDSGSNLATSQHNNIESHSNSGSSTSGKLSSRRVAYLGTEISEPTPRSGHTMIYLKSNIVVMYGNVHGQHVPTIEAYNTITCVWQRLQILGDYVAPRSGHTTTVYNAETSNPLVLLIGGKQFFPEVKKLPEMYIGEFNFNQGTVTWRKAEITALTPFSAFFPSNNDTSLVGQGRSSALSASAGSGSEEINAYRGSSQQSGTGGSGTSNTSGGGGFMMQQVASQLLQRSYHTAVCYKDRYVYLFGGIADDAYSNDLLELDTKTFILKLIKGDPQLLSLSAEEILDRALLGYLQTDYAPAGYQAPIPRSGHVATILGDCMYIVGSYAGEDANNSVVRLHQFKISTQTWSVIETSGIAPAQRAAPAVIMFPANEMHGVLPKITVIGGYSVEHNICYSDVISMYV